MEEPSGRKSGAITNTRLSHEIHRLANSLLGAVDRDSISAESLALFRDFVVANLRHHHETEGGWPWSQILSASPETGHLLDDLSLKHERLEAAVDRFAGAEVGGQTAGSNSAALGRGPEGVPRSDTAVLRVAAIEVRDDAHLHLVHEEPVLFPAPSDHTTPDQWDELSRRVIKFSRTVAGHLTIGLSEEVGMPEATHSALVNMPENLRRNAKRTNAGAAA